MNKFKSIALSIIASLVTIYLILSVFATTTVLTLAITTLVTHGSASIIIK